MNTISAFVTEEQKKEYFKEHHKKYKENNREHLKEYLKEYRESNKEKIKEQKKEYYQNNKEHFKEYYQNNKEHVKEQNSKKYECECGSIIITATKPKHLKTKKHCEYINSQ